MMGTILIKTSDPSSNCLQMSMKSHYDISDIGLLLVLAAEIESGQSHIEILSQ